MAMRSILKKLSPKVRFMEGLRIPRCISSVADTRDVLNNEAVLCGLEKLLKDGSKVTKATRDEWWENLLSGVLTTEIDERWEKWVESSHELWKKKSEEEQRRELDLRWKYLKDLLHREGIDTSHHRLLLSMTLPDPRVYGLEGGTVEFKIASPDRGLVSIKRLVLDRGHFSRYNLPKQIVNGLLCFTRNMRHAFLIYNPVTGETSPWIEMNRKPEKYSNIAFGFDPQSGEHKVICISSSTEYNWREKISNRPKDQVVDVFTVGKNTWRRIEATPPISLAYENPFYVDGCLYWRFWQEYRDGELEHIMRFDIATEKFRVIPIPHFVIDPDRLKGPVTVGLTEVDGCIAVLDWTYELGFSLWKFHEDADGNIKWTEEVIYMPPYWNRKYDLSIEALTGTNLIFLRSECADSFFYYNRNTKESIRFPISPDCEWFDGWEKIIQL